MRFHYRLIASDHAIAAADLLPERSQAYAATLCWAARYAKDGNDLPRTEKIYRRYIATGAYQPWAKSFGGTCPAPDFGRRALSGCGGSKPGRCSSSMPRGAMP